METAMTKPDSSKPNHLNQKPDRVWLVILLSLNLVAWFLLSFDMVRRWRAMPSHLHFWGIYMAIIFPLVWDTMRREKCGLGSLVGITLAFLGVVMLLLLDCF